MEKANLVSLALFSLTIQAFEMNLYYRSKGPFREKRDIMYADLSVRERSGLVAHMSLGTPAQNFCVIVDTTLDVSVVISSMAEHADWNEKSKFNMALSTTYERASRLFSVRNMNTLGGRDALKLNGIPPTRVTFGVLNTLNLPLGLPVLGDGHLGLGHPEARRKLNDSNLLHVLSENRLIDYKRFTLLCVCARHRNDLEPDAQVVFGSHHKIYPEDFHMVPADVTHPGWKFEVSSLSTSRGGISSIEFYAKLDSTTWLNKASVDRTRLINTALGATVSGNVYVFDCNRMDQLPALIMSLQGADLRLIPEQYVQREETQGQTVCFSSIVADPRIRNEDMILGMAFMEHFLTMFDQQVKKVGFQERVC
ncbi:plasmepsin-2 [Clonorchis sinensis]|uniref:Plasmepsin-2 n=1 Tax=Clonorchis sinensis TaxID=79923 RepID=A0A419QCF0_CLOSI|nr:plasmepsin-2 [Clonorchis sinensis]